MCAGKVLATTTDNVLAVPLAAVFSEAGERFVFVKTETEDGDHFERRPIVLGVTDYAFAEVVKGLASGEIVSMDQTVNSSLPKPPVEKTGSGKKSAGTVDAGKDGKKKDAPATAVGKAIPTTSTSTTAPAAGHRSSGS